MTHISVTSAWHYHPIVILIYCLVALYNAPHQRHIAAREASSNVSVCMRLLCIIFDQLQNLIFVLRPDSKLAFRVLGRGILNA
jgi:hypothetical protein